MDIKERIKALPDSPGVYIFKDENGGPLYIGKAASIKRRCAGHCRQAGAHRSARDELICANSTTIDYITTQSEAEALIYEASLVRANQPRYNVRLKDDKSYPYLALTLGEKFPRLYLMRRPRQKTQAPLLTSRDVRSVTGQGHPKDGSRYFGPYTNVKLVREALRLMRQVFPLRRCRQMPKAVCLNFHIGTCLAPCVDRIDEAKYRGIVDELVLFLEGKRDDLLQLLKSKMLKAAGERDFEEAARLRDRIEALTRVVIKGKRIPAADKLSELKEALSLSSLPRRIEAFDVSNISGREAVGSMVVFLNGKPYKDAYRRFRIKTVVGIDDYAMIREVIRRRYSRALAEGLPMPDLIVVDGGKAHLEAACDELKMLALEHLPIVAIAKEDERLYRVNVQAPFFLPADSKALLLVRHIRDEAHRFAQKYHHLLRSKLVRKG